MINNYSATGRLTADTELKTTKTGKSVTTFILAIERTYAGSDGERQADFVRCVAWGNTAEFVCKYFTKGSMIGIEGAVHSRDYTDKNGNKRYAVEILVKEVSFCGSKSNSGRPVPEKVLEHQPQPEQEPDYPSLPLDYDILDEDLPF